MHRGVATSRNATCSSPEHRYATTPRDDRRRRPPPRPSATAPPPSLPLFPPHYSYPLQYLTSAPRGEEQPARPSSARREVAGVPVIRQRAAAGSRGEWRPRRPCPLPRRRRKGTRSTTTVTTTVSPSGLRCRGAASALAAAPHWLDLPVSNVS